MTPKQAAFVQHYLIDQNATQAAIRAGYSVKTAYSIGEENLRKPEIRAAIDAVMSDTAARLGITAERVMRERSRLAFFDPRRLFASNGEPIPIHELDDDTAAALAGLDVHEEFAGSGAERIDLDLAYVDSRSLRRDVGILVRTVSTVLTGEGAEGHDADDPMLADG